MGFWEKKEKEENEKSEAEGKGKKWGNSENDPFDRKGESKGSHYRGSYSGGYGGYRGGYTGGWRDDDDDWFLDGTSAYKGTTTTKGSGSLSGWWDRGRTIKSWWSKSGDGRLAGLTEGLRTVRRICSIVYNDRIDFAWNEEGQGRTQAEKRIVLDPEPINAEGLDKTEWDEGKRVDVLVGDTLSRAAHYMHVEKTLPWTRVTNTMRKKAQHLANECGAPLWGDTLQKAGEALFNAADYIYTEKKTTEDFPGYRGYFSRERDFVHRPEKEHMVKAGAHAACAEDPRALPAALTETLWNALRPENELNVSPEISPEATRIAQELREAALAATTPAEVEKAAHEALKALAEFSIKDNPDCNKDENPGEGEGPGQMGMAGSRETAAHQLSSEEAKEAEVMVSREWSKEKEKGIPAVGRQEGNRESDVYSIKAEIDRNTYQRTITGIRPLIAKTRAAFSFRNEQALEEENYLRRGILDQGSIHKLLEGDIRVFKRQEIVSSPDVDIGMLIDESGSMGMGGGSRKSRADLARECAILMHTATLGIRGVTVSVWGHTGDCEHADDATLCLRYIEMGKGDINSLGSIQARSNNYDGSAIGYAAGRLQKLGKAPQKVLFVLADGKPCGRGYGGRSGETHVQKVVDASRKAGIDVFCLGMGNGLSDQELERMYGKGGYAMVPDASQLPGVLAKLLKQTLRTGRAA